MLKCVIFDLDGTLIDSFYNWDLIRKKIGVDDLPILSYINNLKGLLKKEAINILESFERRATRRASLHKGAEELLTSLSEKNIKKAIVTNNSSKNVEYLLKKWELCFDEIVTRDDGVWKPSGKPLEFVIERLHLKKGEVVFIGNSNPDRLAAKEAGIRFIQVDENEGFGEVSALIDHLGGS